MPQLRGNEPILGLNITFLEIVKEEDKDTNEELRSVHKECFCLLNEIHKNKGDQLKLGMHIENIKDKYQKAQNFYEKIID
jgi:hypothetical protein